MRYPLQPVQMPEYTDEEKRSLGFICPYCHANRGYPCSRQHNGPHPERMNAYRERESNERDP